MIQRLNSFTVDVEDGISIAMRDYFGQLINPTSRVVINTEIVLDLLNDANVKATFFIQGETGKHYPDLIRKIACCGHEIGVHSYSHTNYFKMTSERVWDEITYTKAMLEDITGNPVYGHRAPAFSINNFTKWALPIIAKSGFIYDSSIMPAVTRNYGWSGANKNTHLLRFQEGNLVEVPMSVINFLGKSFPACGGSYLKLSPFFYTKFCFERIQRDRSVIVYMHPYEIDTEKYPDFFYKAMSSLRLHKRIPVMLFRINKGTVKNKLRLLLLNYKFRPLIETVNEFLKSTEKVSSN